MDEIEFIESIDASFPYDDENKWKELIKKGSEISDNASFMVLYEICHAPEELAVEKSLDMVCEWEKYFSHPIRDLVVESAKAIIEGRGIPSEKAIVFLKQISKYKGLYNALAVVYHSCGDTNGEVDDVYNQIVKKWKSS